MTNNRFTDILNSDTDGLATGQETVAPDSGSPLEDKSFSGSIPSEPLSGSSTLQVFSLEQVSRAEARVVQTGVLDKFAAWRSEDAATGATTRPVHISDRALLVGLLLLASEHGPLRISSLADVFQYRLTPEARALLDLPTPTNTFTGHIREGKRWYGRAHNAFHRMLALMDPFPQGRNTASTYTQVQAVLDAHDSDREKQMKVRLDEFTKGFLHMTFMQQPRHLRRATSRIDLSLDQMFIASPTLRGFSKKNLKRKVADEIGADRWTLMPGPVDVFAGWYVRGTNNGRLDFAWGWAANIAVRVDSERPGESRFPKLAISATLSMPNVRVAEEALSLMRSALDTGLAPGIADADRGYFADSPVERLHKPTFELGFTPSTDYRVDQLGVRGGKAGATFIEGKAYCPGMPQRLQNASKDLFNGTIDEGTYQLRLQERLRFELRPKGKPDAKGRVRMMCPAAGGSPTVTCPVREIPNDVASGRHPLVTDDDYAHRICTQQSVTFDKDDGMRQRQAFTYGSKEWREFRTHARHSRESVSASVKNPNRENLGAPSRRPVRGFAAAQVFVTISLTNYNLRTIAAFVSAEIRDHATKAPATEAPASVRRRDRVSHIPFVGTDVVGTGRAGMVLRPRHSRI